MELIDPKVDTCLAMHQGYQCEPLRGLDDDPPVLFFQEGDSHLTASSPSFTAHLAKWSASGRNLWGDAARVDS